MSLTVTRQVEELLRDSLKELESAKGSVLTGVQKLQRAARLLGEEDVVIWCEIQLGASKYTQPLRTHIDKLNEAIKASAVLEASKVLEAKRTKAAAKKPPSKKTAAKKPKAIKHDKEEKALNDYREHLKKLEALGLKQAVHFPVDEIRVKANEAGAGI